MNLNEFHGSNLRRRNFDDVITEAYLDFLFDRGVEELVPAFRGEFIPVDTPNRNPMQVPDGLWCRLIYKHVTKHFYN